MHRKSLYKLIKVIKLGIEDLEHCMELDKKTFGGIWSINQWQEELNNPSRLRIGIREETTLVGLAIGCYALEEINITLIAVAPSYQKLGIGKLIVKSLISQAKKNGAKVATLEVKEKNLAGQSLYKSLNFKQIGYRKRFYSDGSDAIILQRSTDKS